MDTLVVSLPNARMTWQRTVELFRWEQRSSGFTGGAAMIANPIQLIETKWIVRGKHSLCEAQGWIQEDDAQNVDVRWST